MLKFEEAEKDLLKALEINELNFLTNKMLVELYIDFKKFDKSLIYCNLMITKGIEKDFFISKIIISKIYSGNWDCLNNDLIKFNKNLNHNCAHINPLFLKYLNDDPLFQKNFLKIFGKINIKTII